MEFTDKTVFVTGAGSGIGQAAAELFGQKGAKVAVGDINAANAEATAQRIRQAGGEAMAVSVDVTQREQIDRAVGAVRQAYGPIGILVNNAGIAHRSTTIMDAGAEIWQRILSTNLKSVLLCTQAVVPHMIEQGGGRIVNTASTASKVPRLEIGPYCVSKAGVLHLTRCLAMELAEHRITVNAIGPGSVVTNLRENSGVPAGEARRDSQLNGEMEKFRIGIPLGRLGQPIDQAHAIVFLASDEAEYISGQCLFVDGLHGQC
ncbi:SDR family NAD(P)-dependent oxidoreductase [Candidatus Entotheonella palauensis]|uniref:Short-chain dehydrogenase n=1 Tax=Candidatus Entotheonella gemina TaxID=1429439 RepID=W4M9F0_9BACT|nr:SDR family oxidoreductase [Candidatus Entotheonella palauensis]ETX06785.1 MAG: hypothetical protein ETSY2_15050 [Candidatus Entotheonella gemina]